MKKFLAFVVLCVFWTTGLARAADPDTDTKAAIAALQAQLDAVKAQLDALQARQRAHDAAAAAATPAPVPSPGSFVGLGTNKAGNVILSFGKEKIQLYGNLDVSFDETTKGLAKYYAFSGDSPIGNMGYMSAISTNLSYFGLRGDHAIGPNSGIVYQLEGGFQISSTPGISESNNNTSDQVNGALFSRNSYVGVRTPSGTFKIGKTDAPYKNSTARFNPFAGEIGDYAVIMGNSGGDNRVEFGTRLDHALWYESPDMHGLNFAALVAPGQNRSGDDSNIAAGESDCAGGNVPGSGALPPFCNDGSFGTAYSTSLTDQVGKAYLATAYELHMNVNRVSDLADLDPNDVGNESAVKGGIQWAFSNATSLGGIYEYMHRTVPEYLEYQNERTRSGFWFDLQQELDRKNSLAFGWGRANPTPGDPGQHNTPAAANPDNMANLYTTMFRHKIDKNVSWYTDWALTLNHAAAHYDLGAGGRGVTTDCHDASIEAAFDPTANGGLGGVTGDGPHCYAGGHLEGFSTGIDVKF
jgi:predicted porin